MDTSTKKGPGHTLKNQAENTATANADRLLTAQETTALLGLKCRTAHTALNYARRGLIRAVRLNARTVRFSEASVRQLIAGNTEGTHARAA